MSIESTCRDDSLSLNAGEVLSIHLGQAGSQVGHAVWQLLAAEHAVEADGIRERHVNAKAELDNQRSINCFFTEGYANTYVPRSIFVDLEPTVLDEIRVGPYRNLFHMDHLLNGQEDAANLYSRGRYCIGNLLEAPLYNLIRTSIEDCDNLKTIMLHHSIGGGTGSGMATILFDVLEEYRKTTRVSVTVFPSPMSGISILEPYNSVLSTHQSTEAVDMEVVVDNDALFHMCTSRLLASRPSYRHINQVVAQAVSSFTACDRFPNALYGDINTLMTNLIPYPRIHFPVCSMAPFCSSDVLRHELLNESQITKHCFHRDYQLCSCKTFTGKLMGCCLLYRGTINPRDIYLSLEKIKADRKLKFVDWVPTGFKVGICDHPNIVIHNSGMSPSTMTCLLLANNSSMGAFLHQITSRFQMLFSKRSFVHWYVSDGMEESEFSDSHSNMVALVRDYEEVAVGTETHSPSEAVEPGG